MNGELLEAVKEAVIAEERTMRGIDLGSPLWGKRIAQAAIAATFAFIREHEVRDIDRVASIMANLRQGRISESRCEPPTEYDVQRCREQIREVDEARISRKDTDLALAAITALLLTLEN